MSFTLGYLSKKPTRLEGRPSKCHSFVRLKAKNVETSFYLRLTLEPHTSGGLYLVTFGVYPNIIDYHGDGRVSL
jgi:hypothetical protein